jgi:hypothetical protein
VLGIGVNLDCGRLCAVLAEVGGEVEQAANCVTSFISRGRPIKLVSIEGRFVGKRLHILLFEHLAQASTIRGGKYRKMCLALKYVRCERQTWIVACLKGFCQVFYIGNKLICWPNGKEWIITLLTSAYSQEHPRRQIIMGLSIVLLVLQYTLVTAKDRRTYHHITLKCIRLVEQRI